MLKKVFGALARNIESKNPITLTIVAIGAYNACKKFITSFLK